MYNFDEPLQRAATFAFKWERYKDKDIIPSWVADTEFECAPAIIDAMVRHSQHGIFGYHLPKEYAPANEAVIRWCKHQYEWQIESEWIVWTPGVVPAFNMAIRAFTSNRDAVIVQSPNYPPLLASPLINGRKRFSVGSVIQDGRWTLDFETLAEHAAKPETKLFILCNPMNPVGSVLTKDELNKVSDICKRNGVVICSDEIHCDLILDQSSHLPISKIPDLADSSMTLMAASKTFNVAGLGTSFAIVPDKKIRERFTRAGAGIVPWANIMGLVATEIAFTQCDDWHQAALTYLRGNRDYLVEQINKIDGLEAISPQATFLLWVNASGLKVENTQVWAESKGVGPSPGKDFGEPAFFRLNYGCSRRMLRQIVERLSA